MILVRDNQTCPNCGADTRKLYFDLLDQFHTDFKNQLTIIRKQERKDGAKRGLILSGITSLFFFLFFDILHLNLPTLFYVGMVIGLAMVFSILGYTTSTGFSKTEIYLWDNFINKKIETRKQALKGGTC